MQLPPKICPECGEEYVHSSTRCVHCDVPLVVAPETAGEVAGAGLPPADELRLIRTASVSWVRGYSDRLAEAGIAHRVELLDDSGDARRRAGPAGSCGVYVRPADVEAALELDAVHLRTQIPDLPDELAPVDESGESCPACGEAIDAEASECGSCGLPFLDAE